MSTYLSYRRRYSEPEKPEPRFQWRMRVQTLMMSDSDNSPALSERRTQRLDSRRGSREVSDVGASVDQAVGLGYSSRYEDSVDDYRRRRERFTRTKSEGQFRLRMRLSKYGGAGQSFDDADSRADSDPESRRVRFSPKTDSDSPKEEEDEEKQEAFDNNSGDDRMNDSAEADAVNGVGDASGSASCGESSSAAEIQEADAYVKDVSKGAIPKRYSVPPESSLDDTEASDDFDAHLYALGHSEINKSHEVPLKNKGDDGCEDVGSYGEPGSLFFQRRSPSEGQVSAKRDRNVEQAKEDNSRIPTLENNREDDKISGMKRTSVDNSDQIDDIETIIERIIAEEEGMVDKESKLSAIKSATECLSSEDRAKLRDEMKSLEHNVNDECIHKAENGVDIAANAGKNKTRSRSLPSNQSENTEGHINPIVPYSSSCPFSNIGKGRNETAEKDKEDEEKEEEDDGWAYLPVVLLEDVFTLLTPKERHQASQVCRQWYELFYSPRVWETFILLERTLTKKRFNLYKGYQRELCPGKTQICFRRVGSFFKKIIVTPITDYFNLYEFLRILAAFLQYQEDHGLTAMPLLHTFDFTFACASRGDGEILIHGTGGQILEMIKQLLIRMSSLKHLKLNQLLIDVMEVPGLFDAVVNCFGESLNSLEMLNVTKVPLPLMELANFRNLIKLTISPQHLNEEVLILLAGLNLMQLHLVQDPYTCDCEPVSYEAWKLLREMAPWLQVYLDVSGLTRAQVLIQPRAPVYGVFLRTPYSRLTNDLVMSLVEHYSKTLRYFVQERLPRVHGPRGFNHRCDSNLLFLVRRCSNLHTLVIRERMSTSTLILLASEGKSLASLLVRKHALIKRCDWPRCGDWSKEFYSNLRVASLDYDKCMDEVCSLLRRRWRPMTDKQFHRLKIVPRLDLY